MPLIFIDQRGRKCTGIRRVLPAEFGLEKTAKTLEIPQLGGSAGRSGRWALEWLARRCGGYGVCGTFDVFSGQRFRRTACDAFEFDSLFEFEEDLVRLLALEFEIIDDEGLPATAVDVRYLGNAFVAPPPFVELLDLVVLERLAPAGSDARFVGFDPAAPRSDRDRQ